MRLSELLRGLPHSGDLGTDPEVFGVRHDSRTVAAGDLFVTWQGAHFDGVRFAAQAIERGAVAVLADRAPESVPGVPWLVTDSPRSRLAALAAPVYGHPDRALRMVGVTGTNGKSTVVELVSSLCDAAGLPCARIGTLGARFPGLEAVETGRTTPEASDLYRMLASLLTLGAAAVAMEVSSHALEQGRVDGVGFDVAAFTNLTRDHFDFHGDFEAYFASKAKLFEQLTPEGRAVVYLDDPYGARLAGTLRDVIGYGSGGAVAPLRLTLDRHGIRGSVATPRGTLEIDSPLLGRYNLENLLAAIAIGEALELPHDAVAAGIAGTPPLPGRLEPVEAGQEFLALVDFAHTEAALEAAIRAVREISPARLLVVFGCGGDRDPGKRPNMGRIAGSLADLPIVTSDNPRSEDPLEIIGAVEEGLRASGNTHYRVVPDRREAIRRAVSVASGGGWTVLLAGKGHERAQIVGDRRLPFSDREELERAIRERIAAGQGS